jgi:thioredoxin reductase
VEVVRGVPVRADGSARVKGVGVRVGDEERHFKADALVIDAPRAPAYELCEQAGAALRHAPEGFVPHARRGKIRDGIFAIGEVTGARFDVGTFEAAAEEIARQL